MQLVGYSDRWSVGRGEPVRFYVSSVFEEYSAQIVRLIHGDQNPRGPGLRTVPIPSTIDGVYRGRHQPIHTGSYIQIDNCENEFAARGLTIIVWLKATTPGTHDQGVVTLWDSQASLGIGLFVNSKTQTLEGRVSLKDGSLAVVTSSRHLSPLEWRFAALSFDPSTRRLDLRTKGCGIHSPERTTESITSQLPLSASIPNSGTILLGAASLARGLSRLHGVGCFNGKLSAPSILSRPLTAKEDAFEGEIKLPQFEAAELFARWDLSSEPAGRRIRDSGGHGRDGLAVNRPTRAVTGHNWSGRTDSFLEASSEYNAVHFHDDDLEDACWQESFQWIIPEDLRSGVYAVHITSPTGVFDYLPFFVRPRTGQPEAKIAVLIPTLSYMSYSNESVNVDLFAPLCPLRNMALQQTEHAFIESLGIKSTYDLHRDGSGICHVSMLRPSLTSLRPTHRCRLFDGPHQLSADLHLIDWLESKAIPYDIITDHDLHREGVELLSPYRAIVSGTHAEYWTAEMLDALGAYQATGGRFIYLSGNGLYWVTGLDPETQTVCEVRRTNGTRAWMARPGEGRLSFSGEPGGIWASRGRAPQRYVGVGFTAQGFDRGAAYRRTSESYNPRCAFIFDGIDTDLLGDFPTLVMNYGAAGFEVDRADFTLGTPLQAFVVASSLQFSDCYQYVIEDIPIAMPNQGGLANTNVRADMVYYETESGGSVFSVGSIAFCSALSYNAYENNISKLLENVIKAFSRPRGERCSSSVERM